MRHIRIQPHLGGVFALVVLLAVAATLIGTQPARAMMDYDAEEVAELEEVAFLFGIFGHGEGEGRTYGGPAAGGDGSYGGGGGHFFGAILAPVTYALKAAAYALKIPLYAAKTALKIVYVPLSLFQHKEGYRDQ